MAETLTESSMPLPIDATYAVVVAPDALTAWLTLVPPSHGGAAPDMTAARAALAKAGVVFGIDEAALGTALGSGLGARTELAHGIPPQPGIDGWLEPLVELNQQRHPKVDQSGHVDFRDLGNLPSVNVGDALMRRHPPKPGVMGKGVNGKDLPMAQPKNLAFGVRLQGVATDPKDPDLLRAAVAGQPILLRDGVNVEPLVRLESVDISVGNVEFPGSVEIRGDVQSGMRIKAGGDITVGGTIESAEIVAGGNVVARGGIIGHSTQEKKEGGAGDTARITAKGSVKARYMENCVVVAEQSVIVDEAMIHCDVIALGEVVAGGKGSGKGRIVGGFVRATSGVRADVLGGPGSGQTRVFVGVNPLVQKSLDEHQVHLDAKLKENGELTKVLQILKARPDKQEMAEKARLTLQKVNEEIAEIMDETRALEAKVAVADESRVVVGKSTYGGVMVAIGKKSKFIADDTGAGVFVLTNGELVYGDLAAYVA
jgi:uncharacterized protein